MHGLLLPAAVLAFGLVTLFALCVQPSTRLVIAGFLCVPQFFVAGAPLPLAQAWLVSMALAALLERKPVEARSLALHTPLLLGLLAALDLMASLWSPDQDEGVTMGLRTLMFASLVYYGATLAAKDPTILDRSIKWMTPWLGLQAALTIYFRLNPTQEEAFLRSDRYTWLLGSAGQKLFRDGGNNVLDVEKAGGLIVNGNSASLLLGLAALAMHLLSRRTGNRAYLLVMIVCLAAVIATGSKTGIILAVTLPAIGWALSSLAERHRVAAMALALPLLAVTTQYAPSFLARVSPEFATQSDFSYETRLTLWRAGFDLFRESPFTGLGFGGWKLRIPAYVGRDDWPPHNLLISKWADSGLLALAVLVVAIVAITLQTSRAALRDSAPAIARASAIPLVAWTWVLIHGMGDNTSVFGEQRSMVLVAIMICYSFGQVSPVTAGDVTQAFEGSEHGGTPRDKAS